MIGYYTPFNLSFTNMNKAIITKSENTSTGSKQDIFFLAYNVSFLSTKIDILNNHIYFIIYRFIGSL